MQESITDIDAQIEDLLQRLSNLRKRRNSLTKLCRLPTELIVHILKLSQRPEDPPDASIYTYSWEAFDYSWTRLAMTCSYVWNIAVKEPELWTFIQYHSKGKSRTEDSIRYAIQSPLHVRAVNDTKKDKVNAWAVQYLPRARAAYIVPNINDTKGMTALQTALRKPHLALQSLHYMERDFMLDFRFLGGSCLALSQLCLTKSQVANDVPVSQAFVI
jgi:hypothetical protein